MCAIQTAVSAHCTHVCVIFLTDLGFVSTRRRSLPPRGHRHTCVCVLSSNSCVLFITDAFISYWCTRVFIRRSCLTWQPMRGVITRTCGLAMAKHKRPSRIRRGVPPKWRQDEFSACQTFQKVTTDTLPHVSALMTSERDIPTTWLSIQEHSRIQCTYSLVFLTNA